MENIIEIYTLVILMGIGLLFGFYKLTKYAFWCNQLWITVVLLLVILVDSVTIPYSSTFVYFGYTLFLLNIIAFVLFQNKEFSME